MEPQKAYYFLVSGLTSLLVKAINLLVPPRARDTLLTAGMS
jgi:hypothetical protein